MSDPTDGSTAALVDCTATDTADNSTTIRLGIAVADTTAPEFTSVPFNPTTVEADPLTGTAILNLEAGFTAADTADDSPIISCVADTSDVSGNSVGPGIYSITCNASDLSNNVSPDHVYSLQVLDVTDPTFDIVPASFTAEADNSSGATVTFTVTAEDTAGAAIVSCSPLSDTVFPFGPTTVNCTASDSATPPNTATTSFVVTVSDSIAPTFDIVPGSFTAEADSAAGALVSYTKPTASDSAGNATVDCSPAPGTVFGFGATTVTCTATDSATPTPNTAMTSFVVTVSDTTAPTFSSVPGNITAEATSSAGAAVPYSVTATDNGGDPAVSCIPTSGSVFVIGTTLVSCTATDGAMPTPNTTTASFNVTINDSTAPTFDVVPASFTVEADSSAGAFVTYTAPTASDTAGNASVVCSPNSDTVFGFGATTVTCIATDGATPANTATTSFVVTVNDTIAPTFGTVPANFTVEADGTGGATVSYSTPTASDTAGTAIVNCTPGPGTVFGFGITTVTCTASDGASPANTVTATFDVTVADTLAPIVTLLGDPSISLQAGTAYVEPGYSASDIVSGSVLVTVSGAVDSNTPGAYTITYSAVDAAGLIGSASRTVTVIDTMAPIFDPLPVIAPVEATGPGGSIVIYNVTATDLSSGGASVSCAPTSGSTFAIGTTAVNCTATDTSSPPNTATASFSITVADSTAPAFNFVPGDISVTTFTLDADVEYSAASLGLTSTDIVDGPRPAVCTRDDDPASTSVNFGYGTWGITCTASDSASPINTATTAFDIIVSFGFGIELQLPKGNIRAGSTLPLDWQYLNLANPNIVEESGFIVPAIKWEGPFASRDCAGVPGSVDGEDSGSSGFRYSASKKTWQYSWQTPIESGGYVVTVSPPGNPLGTPASACVFLR